MNIEVKYEDIEYQAIWWIRLLDNKFMSIFDWEIV